MNTTPERALELAEYMIDDMNGDVLPGGLVATEVAAVCRAYAELAKKWQAVLDAEPIDDAFWNGRGTSLGDASWHVKNRPECAHLIIKPTA